MQTVSYRISPCMPDFSFSFNFRSEKSDVDGIVPASVGECGGLRVAFGIIKMTSLQCSQIVGAWNGNPGANSWIDCHLDWCVTINCEPRDEWKDIQTCDNKLSSSVMDCRVDYTVGTTNTKEISSTSGISVSVSVEHSVGVALKGNSIFSHRFYWDFIQNDIITFLVNFPRFRLLKKGDKSFLTYKSFSAVIVYNFYFDK